MPSHSAPRVIVSTPEPNSGSAKYVARLAVALHGAGMPTVLFCPANFAYADPVRAAGIEIVAAPSREVTEAGFFERLIRNLRFLSGALLKHHRLARCGDVVHFQFPLRMPLGAFFYWSAKLKGATVVLTAHDPLPHRWRLPHAMRWIERAALRMEYRSCGAVIAHNRKGQQVLSSSFGLPQRRVFVVPHGLYFDPPPLSPFPDFSEFRILAFGSIRENKGLHFAIEAVQQLFRERSIPVRLSIAGSLATVAESGYWQSCKRLIEQAPEAFSVNEEFIPDDQVAALIARHNAVILPYAEFHSESGIAALALSSARPIIATASGGLGELMQASQAGVTIHAPTTEAVAAAIAQAFTLGRERLQAMGLAGRRYLESTRNWERIAEMTGDVYRMARTAPRSERRILIHTPEPESSAARYVFELVEALTGKGVEIDVVCPENHQAMGRFESNPRITVHACAARSTRPGRSALTRVRDNLGFTFSSALVLFRTARRGDLIHFQYAMHLPLEAVFFACARLRGCTIAFTAHDPLPHKWTMPRALRWMEEGALRWMYRVSDIILVHSAAGRQTVLGHFAEPESKVRVVPHGPYPMSHAPAQPQSERLEMLFFGALRENKGPHLVIQAAQRLYRQGVTLRLTIAGRVMNSKERAYWARCTALIASDPEPIRLIEEFIPEERLPTLFSGCHCLVLPYGAFFSDSGVASLALANGKPLLATGAGGLEELLRASGGGILIEAATVEAVEAAIRKALEIGADRLQQMGCDGRAWVLRECGWQNIAGRIREIYDSAPGSLQGTLQQFLSCCVPKWMRSSRRDPKESAARFKTQEDTLTQELL